MDRPTAAPDSLSPSLWGSSHGAAPRPAYEIKFLLDEARAQDLESRLLHTLLPDPHSDPALGGMYAITSLALEAADFPIFFRDPRVDSCKYRVRRYGDADILYLERKRSRNGKVQKLRTQAAAADLSALAVSDSPDSGLAHAWFIGEIRRHGLAPVCRIRCLRRALFGVCQEGTMRVTLDRSIRGSLAPGWCMDKHGPERPLLDGMVVCEFKFVEAMPSPMKRVITDMSLEATGLSKYRTCIRAFAQELNLDLATEAARTLHA